MKYLIARFPAGVIQLYGPFLGKNEETQPAIEQMVKTVRAYFGPVLDYYVLSPLNNMELKKLD